MQSPREVQGPGEGGLLLGRLNQGLEHACLPSEPVRFKGVMGFEIPQTENALIRV